MPHDPARIHAKLSRDAKTTLRAFSAPESGAAERLDTLAGALYRRGADLPLDRIGDAVAELVATGLLLGPRHSATTMVPADETADLSGALTELGWAVLRLIGAAKPD